MLTTLQNFENKLKSSIHELVEMIEETFDRMKADVGKRRDTLRAFEQLRNIL